VFVCGTVGLLTPTASQAEAFWQAPLVKKWFQKTVCGFRNPDDRFVISGDKVCDRTTGDIWEQDPDTFTRPGMSHGDALAFCLALDKGDGQVYELPSVQQLVSVLDYTERDPALTPGVFSNVRSDFYWSATPVAGLKGFEFKFLVGVGGSNGWVIEDNRLNGWFVWCVQRDKDAHADW